MNLADSVIMPREDFVELSTAAWDQTPATAGERIAGTVQTIVVCSALSGAFAAGCWAWAKSTDWLEEKRFNRQNRSATR